MTDFTLNNHGTISILTPVSEAGADWIFEHIPDNAMTWGGGIVIEHRYVEDIVQGIINDNMEINHG